jgi:hypothetical protein
VTNCGSAMLNNGCSSSSYLNGMASLAVRSEVLLSA